MKKVEIEEAVPAVNAEAHNTKGGYPMEVDGGVYGFIYYSGLLALPELSIQEVHV